MRVKRFINNDTTPQYFVTLAKKEMNLKRGLSKYRFPEATIRIVMPEIKGNGCEGSRRGMTFTLQ